MTLSVVPVAHAPPDPVADFVAAYRDLMAARGITQAQLRVPYPPEAPVRAGQQLSRSVLSRVLVTKRRFPEPKARAGWYARAFVGALRDLVPSDALAPLEDKIAAIESHLVAASPEAPADATPPDLPEPEMLSREAIRHFRLTAHPFVDDVAGPEDVFLSVEQRYIAESMWHAARHSGLIAVIGESGSGKSTLRRHLVERIIREQEPVIVLQPRCIDKRRLTAAHICDAIIGDLSDETPRQSLEAKARQVERILTDSSRGGNRHVVIVEEAHDLTLATLKYLKRFWELEDGFRRLLGIILIGQPELGQMLDERRNFGARELIRRCEVAHLEALDEHLADYLELKLRRVGGTVDQVLAPGAVEAIRERLTITGRGQVQSHCYPLVVHNLLARCMNQALELGFRQVDADLVRGI